MLSIIIPSRNEQFLTPTTKDLLMKAKGDIEIIIVLDGYWVSSEEIINDPRVIYLHKGISEGMREAINSGVAIAKGEYIMKIDGHCIVDEGFDLKLIADCEDNWVVVPRRKRLDAENWCIQEVGKPDIDAMYLCYPENPMDFGGPGLNGKLWTQRAIDRKDVLIDDEMSGQGSSWFMHRDYFYKLDLMDHKNWGPFWNEFQEISLKCWLSGGRVIRNKKTWYAHLHKGKKYGRGYFMSKSSNEVGSQQTKKFMKFGKAWDKQTKPLSWLIEKFMPIPTWDEEKLKLLKETEYEE